MAENIIEILIEAKNTAKEGLEEAKADSKETSSSIISDQQAQADAAKASAAEAAAAAQEAADAQVAALDRLKAAEAEQLSASAEMAAAADGDTAAEDRFIAATEGLTKAQQDAASASAALGGAQEDLAAKTDAASAAQAGADAKTDESSAGGMASFGKLSMVAVAAGAVVVGAAIDMGEEFQEATAKMAASSGMTQQQATALGNAFLNTAGKSTFSAQQMEAAYGPVAAKLTALNGSALTVAQSMDVMEAAQNAAEATGQDLNGVTQGLASVMQTYKLNVDQASSASDTLTNASRLTGAPISTLAGAMDKLHAKLGPMAPDLQDTGTLVAALAQQGLTGSRGIASVNSAFTTLEGGSKSTAAEIKTLGLTVNDSKGNFVGMSSIIDQLNPKFAKMSQAQQEAAGKALFGSAAQGALNGIISAGAPAYDALSDKVNEVGSAHEGAEKATDTFKGGMEKLEASGKDLLTMLGNDLMPIVMIVMKGFQAFANALIAAGVWINNNRVWLGLLATVIGAIAGPILVVVGAIKMWELATKAFTAVQAALNLVMDANPIAIIIIALIAIVAAVIYAWNHFSGFRDFIKGMWADIKEAFETAKDFIMDVFGVLRDGFDSFTSFVGQIPGKIGSFFSSIGSGIVSGLKSALNGLISIADSAISGINKVTGIVGIPAIPQIPHVAIGGPVSGLALVGENGPELANFPAGTNISPNSNTMSMLGGMGGGGSVNVSLGFSGNTDSALATLLMKLVRTNVIQLNVNGKPVRAS